MKRSIRTLAATAVLVLATGGAYADESYDGPSGRYGRGKDVARVAGALIGGAIGHNVSVGRQRERDARAQTYERCDVRYRERTVERIDGYDGRRLRPAARAAACGPGPHFL